jgi:hypothetical protein
MRPVSITADIPGGLRHFRGPIEFAASLLPVSRGRALASGVPFTRARSVVMAAPLTVRFRHVRAARALEAEIRERFERLSRYCPTIAAGRVVVERTGLHHQGGQRYRVQIVLTLPHGDVTVAHQPSARASARAAAES